MSYSRESNTQDGEKFIVKMFYSVKVFSRG